ncbi:transcriptional regulator, partial [Streptomyces sp. TRM76130]|nr:transcriptional regulator [Streptomyces sp. TRM76130]
MAPTARHLLETTTGKLAPDPRANRFLPLVARGAVSRETLAALALEQR